MEDFLSDMALISEREKTFKKWPFKVGPCAAKEMAKAGFYMPPQKPRCYSVKCYYCQKELDGWVADDNPFTEHKKHASYCCFVNAFKKAPESLTLRQVIELERDRIVRKWEVKKIDAINKFNAFLESVVEGKNVKKREV